MKIYQINIYKLKDAFKNIISQRSYFLDRKSDFTYNN